MATNRFDFKGNITGASLFGSFEEHMLETMRNTIDRLIFIPCTNINPHANRRRLQV
jgi:hypothetical protein